MPSSSDRKQGVESFLVLVTVKDLDANNPLPSIHVQDDHTFGRLSID